MATDAAPGGATLDPENPVIKLCVAGMQAEGQGRNDQARGLFQQAWDAATDDLEACIAAHYRARQAADPVEELHWNRTAIERADATEDERVRHFYPSLYLNLGRSYETLGRLADAQQCYDRAAFSLNALPVELHDGNAALGIDAAQRRMAARNHPSSLPFMSAD